MVQQSINFDNEIFAQFKVVAHAKFPYRGNMFKREAYNEALQCFIDKYGCSHKAVCDKVILHDWNSCCVCTHQDAVRFMGINNVEKIEFCNKCTQR